MQEQPSNLLKPSRYNFYTVSDGTRVVFNTLTAALSELNTCNWEALKRGDLVNLDDSLLQSLMQEGFVVDNKRDEFSEYMATFDAHRRTEGVLFCQVLMSLGCNLACPYCFQGAPSKIENIITRSALESILLWIRQESITRPLKTLRFNIYGGEPLLARDHLFWLLPELAGIKKDYKLDLQLSMATNGVLLTDDLIFLLVNHKVEMQITVDGEREIHDRRRVLKNGEGTYDRIMHNIEQIIASNGQHFLRVRINIDKVNLKGIPKLLNLLHSMGVLKVECGYVHFRNLRHPYQKRCIAPDLVPEQLERKLYPILNTYGYADSITDLPLKTVCAFNKLHAYCITPDLRVYKCEELAAGQSHPIGYISKHNRLVLEGDNYYRQTGRVPTIFAKCSSCIYLPLCGSGCAIDAMGQSGDIYASHCVLSKKQLDKKIANLLYCGSPRFLDSELSKGLAV